MTQKLMNTQNKEITILELEEMKPLELLNSIENGEIYFGEALLSDVLDKLVQIKVKCVNCGHRFTKKQKRTYFKILIYQKLLKMTDAGFRYYCPKCKVRVV